MLEESNVDSGRSLSMPSGLCKSSILFFFLTKIPSVKNERQETLIWNNLVGKIGKTWLYIDLGVKEE
jgi:hypothetical protein